MLNYQTTFEIFFRNIKKRINGSVKNAGAGLAVIVVGRF